MLALKLLLQLDFLESVQTASEQVINRPLFSLDVNHLFNVLIDVFASRNSRFKLFSVHSRQKELKVSFTRSDDLEAKGSCATDSRDARQ